MSHWHYRRSIVVFDVLASYILNKLIPVCLKQNSRYLKGAFRICYLEIVT